MTETKGAHSLLLLGKVRCTRQASPWVWPFGVFLDQSFSFSIAEGVHAFRAVMREYSHDMLSITVSAYVNDFLIYSHDTPQFELRPGVVLRRLLNARFYLERWTKRR